MGNQNTVTIQFPKTEYQRVKDTLTAYGWQEEQDDNQYVVYRLRSPKGSVGIMYFSGKLVFQGREDFSALISALEKGSDLHGEFIPHMGVDEVGKGDYFGPLVVVGCFVNDEFFKKVKLLGFADSKKFNDERIEKFFNIVKDYPYYYSSIVHPNDYNRMAQKYKNASVLLAKQHSQVIEEGLNDLKKKGIECSYVVIDQFSPIKSRVINELGPLGKHIRFIQFHKGESDIAVAAASIIARGIFIREWRKMEERYDFHFPKGATSVVDNARLFVSRYGKRELSNVAKIGFKTTNEVLR